MGLTLIEYEKWNHVDFLWGVDANELFNHQLRQLVKNVINSPDFILSRVEKALVERNQDSVLVDESSDDKNFLNNNNNEIYTFANITKFTQNNLIYRVSSEYSYIIKQKYDVKAEDPKNGTYFTFIKKYFISYMHTYITKNLFCNKRTFGFCF